MAEFQHDGITFHYRTFGEGRPLVFTHGLAWDLNRSLELLDSMPGNQLIVWDTRAHGQTTPFGPEEGFSFPTFATDLSALLDHLKIDRAVIGGISMGAAISAQFAVENPERLLGSDRAASHADPRGWNQKRSHSSLGNCPTMGQPHTASTL